MAETKGLFCRGLGSFGTRGLFARGLGEGVEDGGDGGSADWNVRRLQIDQRRVRISTRVRPVRFPNPRR